MECEATEREEIMKLAWPAVRVLVARDVAPSLKVTVPVGMPMAGLTALSVAVNVIDCPNTDGFTDEITAATLLPLLTVWVRVAEVLALKLPSAPYTAVIEWAATLSEEVLKEAWPELSVPV